MLMSHFDTTVKRLTPFQNMYVGNYKVVSYYKTTYVICTFNPIYNVLVMLRWILNYKSSCFRLLMMYYNVRLALLTHCHMSHALLSPFSYILFSSEKSTMDTSCYVPYILWSDGENIILVSLGSTGLIVLSTILCKPSNIAILLR